MQRRREMRAKKWFLIGTMIAITLAGVYLAGILTVIYAPRYNGNFRYSITCGESGTTVTSTSQVCERTWLGLGPVRSYRQIVVSRDKRIGDDFPYEATTPEELSLRPGDRVMRNNRGHFEKMAPRKSSAKREMALAKDLPLPPPPPSLNEEEIKKLASRRFDDAVEEVRSRFLPVLDEVQDETDVLYEAVPVKTANPGKKRLR